MTFREQKLVGQTLFLCRE